MRKILSTQQITSSFLNSKSYKSLLIGLAFLGLFTTSCSSLFYQNRSLNNSVLITSNVEDFYIEFPLLNEKTNKYSGSLTASSGRLNYQLPKLKKQYQTIDIKHPNYETKRVKLDKVVRPGALAMDIGLSIWTFGLPLIIDPFRSDFYKLTKNSKEKNLNLDFNQSFMEHEYLLIHKSKDPLVYINYIQKYPKSKILQQVYDKKDSLELSIALSQNQEKAIDDFISTHPRSTYLIEAQKIKDELEQARLAFDLAKTANNVNSYEGFLLKFPKSLFNIDAHVSLINAAEKMVLSSNNSGHIVQYINNYLYKYKDFLRDDSFSDKNKYVMSELQKQIIKEHPRTDYAGYSEFWKRFQEVDNELTQSSDFSPFGRTYKQSISNLLFASLKECTSESKYNELKQSILNDFPGLYSGSILIYEILDNSNKKEGSITLYNSNYLQYSSIQNISKTKVRNSNNRIAKYSLSDSYNYKGVMFGNFQNVTLEKLNFKENELDAPQEAFSSSEIIYKVVFENQHAKEENFYQNGKLVVTNSMNENNTIKYTYEFDNGRNITFENLDKKIKETDQLLKEKKYQEALDSYNELSKNNFPSDIEANIKLRDRITKCETANNEQVRIAEEKKKQAIESYVFSVTGNYISKDYEGPITLNGLYLYIILNKKNVILMAMGRSFSEAFSDAANGMRSGRIKSGSYTYDQNYISVTWRDGSKVRWQDGGLGTIRCGNGITLELIDEQ